MRTLRTAVPIYAPEMVHFLGTPKKIYLPRLYADWTIAGARVRISGTADADTYTFALISAGDVVLTTWITVPSTGGFSHLAFLGPNSTDLKKFEDILYGSRTYFLQFRATDFPSSALSATVTMHLDLEREV